MIGPAPGVAITRLGVGTAAIGNLYRAMSDGDAAAAVDAAWLCGVRYFDTAPHYGLGLAERRLGAALAGRPRAEYTLSTKVGRLLVPNPGGEGQRDLGSGFDVPAALRRQWDFSRDGVRRSLAESLERLGLSRVDLALIHDPDESEDPDAALRSAAPALAELRAQGVVGAIGVGSKQCRILERFVAGSDIDAIMLAGRYTLLEQPALDTLLPACARRGVAVLIAGAFNSGLLAEDWPADGASYDYRRAPAELVDRARQIATVCRRHGTRLPHAALAFAGAHPAVASVVIGPANAAHVLSAAAQLAAPTPAALWEELRAEGLLRPDAPVPRS